MNQDIKTLSKEIRRETLDLALETKNGHLGSALSIVEILIALYYEIMDEKDVFVLSKGHGCLSWYATLRRKSFCPDVAKNHPDVDPKNGIVCTTGSEGHGLPVGVGMALAKKLKGESGRIYVLMGDGESQEGTTWESLLVASHHNLDNLWIIIDRNRLQALDNTEEILALDSMSNKILAFECDCYVASGHDVDELTDVFNIPNPNCPQVVIANTIKGKGISYMEGVPKWHNKLPNEKELKKAKKELK